MLSPVELAVLAFAGYRGTQLVVHDSILDSARARVDTWHQRRPESTTRTAVVTLISCVYCTGWWIAGALLLTYLLVTGQWDQTRLVVHGIEWLALAGGSVLMNRWDDSPQATHSGPTAPARRRVRLRQARHLGHTGRRNPHRHPPLRHRSHPLLEPAASETDPPLVLVSSRRYPADRGGNGDPAGHRPPAEWSHSKACLAVVVGHRAAPADTDRL